MAHRATTTAVAGTATTASVNVPGSPAVAGDIAVLIAATSSAITTDLTSSGWTVVGTSPTTVSSGRMQVWCKTLVSGDIGATINLTSTASTRWALAVHVRSGVTQLYPTPVFNTTSSTTDTPTCESITAVAGTELVSVYGCITNALAQTLTGTPPAGQTERADICSASGSQRNAYLLVADESVSAGATGTRTATTVAGAGDARVQSGTVTLAFVANLPPTANAGSDQTVDAGSTVTLHGSGSDTDGTVASYAWTQVSGPTVTLSSSTVAEPTFTAPALGTLVFGLTVTDNGGATSTQDQVTVNVTPAYATVKVRIAGAWVTKPMKVRVAGAWV